MISRPSPLRFPLRLPIVVSSWFALATAGGLSLSPCGAEEAWWDRIDESQLPPATTPIAEVIDRYLDEGLKRREVTPATTAPLETRLRRLMLDLHGRVPTVGEMDAYLAAGDTPQAWAGLVERLIAAPAFDRHLANELNWLLMDGQGSDFQKYLDLAVAQKRGWDAVFRETITGQVDPEARPGVDQFLRQRVADTDRLANDVSVRFFGVNISCAQCHDHPYVKTWTQDTYYGMKSFFSRTFDNGGYVGEREYGLVSYKTTANEEKAASLKFFGGEALPEPPSVEPSEDEKKAERARLEEYKKNKQAPPPAKYSRRARLVEAGLAPEQEHWFARSIVNRTWDRLFGHGLVMPLDQMHGENEPSHPELMQWLARDLAAHDYDLRRLVRGIVTSRAWQRDSQWESGDRPPLSLFAVAHPRPLTPRQIAQSLRFAAMDPESFAPGKGKPEEIEQRVLGTERGAASYERWFERPGEDFQVSVDEALFLSNSPDVQSQLLDGSGLVKALEAKTSPAEQIRLASRAIWQREPSDEEVSLLSSYLDARSDRPRDGLRQLVWAMLSSAEFRFNH
ncbi:MAG: DUF1553 domain-containing protein [Verrucomicrobiales bacterium]|nr:DUF1553 domain-containing protein [Verrucomicrobiales bacterium]